MKNSAKNFSNHERTEYAEIYNRILFLYNHAIDVVKSSRNEDQTEIMNIFAKFGNPYSFDNSDNHKLEKLADKLNKFNHIQ